MHVRLDGQFCAVHAVADMLRSVCLTYPCLCYAGLQYQPVGAQATHLRRLVTTPHMQITLLLVKYTFPVFSGILQITCHIWQPIPCQQPVNCSFTALACSAVKYHLKVVPPQAPPQARTCSRSTRQRGVPPTPCGPAGLVSRLRYIPCTCTIVGQYSTILGVYTQSVLFLRAFLPENQRFAGPERDSGPVPLLQGYKGRTRCARQAERMTLVHA